MPKKAKYELIQGRFFRWRIKTSSHGVWYADGRSNQPGVGRHSLGTRDKDDAVRLVQQLDIQMAVKFGVADRSILGEDQSSLLLLTDGIEKYLKFTGRPKVIGGSSKATVQRYRPVFRKFSDFARSEGVVSWNHVTKSLLESYATWLDDQGYAYRTETLELTTVKQCVNWLTDEKMIPERCQFKLSVPKANGSPTYCYREPEARSMIQYCAGEDRLIWLGRVVCLLVYTGMRIGEAAQLEWSDIELDDGIIYVRDSSRGAVRGGRGDDRSTKSSRGRVVPIHPDLMKMFHSMSRSPGRRVFRGPREGRLKPDTVREILKRDVLPPVAKQMYPRNPSPEMLEGRVHSLRHTFCTIAYRAGWRERMILDVMGHRSSSITQLYKHLEADDYRSAMDAFASMGTVYPGRKK